MCIISNTINNIFNVKIFVSPNFNNTEQLVIFSVFISNISENNLITVTVPREYFGPVTLSNLNIQLLDEYGRLLDLNNMDYSFCLTLTRLYDL